MIDDAYFAALPAAQRPEREALLRAFADAGFPGPALDSWHYTDFAGLAGKAFAVAPDAAAPAFPHDPAQRLPLAPVAPGDLATGFALDDLNAALAAQGVDKVWEGTGTRPLLIAHADPGAGAMAHFRHRFSLLDGAEATLVVWDAGAADGGNASASLLTAVLELAVSPGSRLTVLRVQEAPAQATRALRVQARVAAGATLTLLTLDLSAARSRFELHAELAGPGAAVEVTGLTAVTGKAHADTQVHVTHAAPRCRSTMDFRLLAAGRARVVFNGKAIVAPGADKTDSNTHCRSLLLSDGAEIDAKPELEINADDVKCAHGATFGQLDPIALFYLRSRGIDVAEARGLLTEAFVEEVLERIPLPGLRAHAQTKLRVLLAEATP